MARELARCELVGVAGPPERGQHVELALPQAVSPELDLQLLAQAVAEPVQPPDDALRGHVDVRALAAARGADLDELCAALAENTRRAFDVV